MLDPPANARAATDARDSSSARPTLSAILITYNAERLLDRVLASLQWVDEIVVVDRGSTDRTEEIARRYTDRFYVREWAGFGVQKQRALELATGDWVLSVDADEVVTPELRRSIERAIAAPARAVGFEVGLLTHFAGRWFGSLGWRYDRKVRLVRRDRAYFSTHVVHEGVHVDGPVGGLLEGKLLHYPYRDLEHLTDKMNQYSTGMARRRFAEGKRSSAPVAVLRGIARFLRDWIAGGDFLYGGAGLIRSTLSGYYTFLTYAKLWELGRGADASGAPGTQTAPEPRAPGA